MSSSWTLWQYFVSRTISVSQHVDVILLLDFGFKRSTKLQELNFNKVGISGKTDPTSIKMSKARETRADPFEVKAETAH